MGNVQSAKSKFTFDPTNKVVGSIDAASDVQAAISDLKTAGFTAQDIELLADEAGVSRISEADDVLVHVFDSTQRIPAFYDAPLIVRRVEEELRAGHYLVGVFAEDAEARERARAILKSHGGHFINFYGRLAAEALDP